MFDINKVDHPIDPMDATNNTENNYLQQNQGRINSQQNGYNSKDGVPSCSSNGIIEKRPYGYSQQQNYGQNGSNYRNTAQFGVPTYNQNGPQQYRIQTKICKKCKQTIPSSAAVCPYCNAKQKKANAFVIFLVVAAILFVWIPLIGSFKNKSPADAAETTVTAPEQSQAESSSTSKTEPASSDEGGDHHEENVTVTRDDYNTGIQYSQLARTPDQFKGQRVKFSGKVVQIVSEGNIVEIRFAVNGDSDQVLYGEYAADIVQSRILEDDEITIYGESEGLVTYKTVLGDSKSIPSVKIEIIDIIDQQADSTVSYESNIQRLEYETNYEGAYRYHAIIEIENTGDTNIYITGATFDIEDTDGKLLQTDDLVSRCPDVIKPGEKGYLYNQFGTTLDGIDDIDNIQLVPNFVVNPTMETPHEYVVSDTSIKDGNYGVSVIGRLTNDTDEDVSYLYIHVLYYDIEGNILGISGTSITDFNAGRTVSFDISGMDLPDSVTISDVADYRIIAEEESYLY